MACYNLLCAIEATLQLGRKFNQDMINCGMSLGLSQKRKFNNVQCNILMRRNFAVLVYILEGCKYNLIRQFIMMCNHAENVVN